MTIRPVEARDAEALSALKKITSRETFLEGGFAIPYPPDDYAAYEASTFGVENVAREIADPAHRQWVAVGGDGQLLAYVHVGPCKLPHPEATEADGELYQLYALRSAQGTGVGRALLDVGLGWLEVERPGRHWLGVWSGNDRAQAVYAKRGFAKVGEYGFRVGSWTDHEFIFRRD